MKNLENRGHGQISPKELMRSMKNDLTRLSSYIILIVGPEKGTDDLGAFLYSDQSMNGQLPDLDYVDSMLEVLFEIRNALVDKINEN